MRGDKVFKNWVFFCLVKKTTPAMPSSKTNYRSNHNRKNERANIQKLKGHSKTQMGLEEWNRAIIKCNNTTQGTEEHLTVREAKLRMRGEMRSAHQECLRCYNLLLDQKRRIETDVGVGTVHMAEKKWQVRVAFFANLHNNNVEKAQYKRDKWVRYATEDLENFMEQGEKDNKFAILEADDGNDGIQDINENAILNWANHGKSDLETLDEMLANYKFLWRC